jgi:hypothetical protein
MLRVEECQTRADECARLAAMAISTQAAAHYRFLERSWLYLVRLKLRKQSFETALNSSAS